MNTNPHESRPEGKGEDAPPKVYDYDTLHKDAKRIFRRLDELHAAEEAKIKDEKEKQ